MECWGGEENIEHLVPPIEMQRLPPHLQSLECGGVGVAHSTCLLVRMGWGRGTHSTLSLVGSARRYRNKSASSLELKVADMTN